ncbi:MAG: hypothetical protein GX557_00855 [Chloroflexi bacterium]|nr:hypothetical protein [Chloroflexota bacterium]
MKTRLGFLPCHRYPYDEDWASDMRQRCQKALRALEDVELVTPSGSLMHNGLLRDDAGAQAAIDLFAQRGVHGLLLGAMTRADEVAACSVAQALNVPVLVLAACANGTEDESVKRSDAWAGALAIAAGLRRRKIAYAFAGAFAPEDEGLRLTVASFARGCAALQSLMGARIGLVGVAGERDDLALAGRAALLQRLRAQVVPIEMGTLLAAAAEIAEDDHRAVAIGRSLAKEADCSACDDAVLAKLARLELALAAQCKERALSAVALSSVEDVQARYGVAFAAALGRLNAGGTLAVDDADVYAAASLLLLRGAAGAEAVPTTVELALPNPQQRNEILVRNAGSAAPTLAAPPAAAVLGTSWRLAALAPERALGAWHFALRPGAVTLGRLDELEGRLRLLIVSGDLVPAEEPRGEVWGMLHVADRERLYAALGEGGWPARLCLVHADVAEALQMLCRAADIEAVRPT